MIVTDQNMKPFYTSEDFPNIDSVGLYVWYTSLTGDFKQHSHSFSETVIILNGSGVHLVGEQEYPISRGDVFAIKGNISHGFNNTQNLEFINLIYDPRIFSQNCSELQSIPGFIPFFVTEPEVRKNGSYSSILKLDDLSLNYVRMMCDFIVSQFENSEHSQKSVIKLNFLALISYIVTKYDNVASLSEDIYTLSTAIDYMEKHISKSIKLGDIAFKVHLSSRQLNRIFNKYIGVSPMIYMRNLRLKYALSLLTIENTSITDIAYKCGFEDPAYFSRIFHNVYGISPSQAKARTVNDISYFI